MKPYYTLADLLDEEHPFDAGETVPARLAVIGFPIAHSKSPAMQQAALKLWSQDLTGNVRKAQDTVYARARDNSLAAQGKFEG